jgi:hypothetical protein
MFEFKRMTMDEIQTNHQGRKNLEKLEFEKELENGGINQLLKFGGCVKKAHAGEHIGYSVPTIWKAPFPSKISKSGPNSPSFHTLASNPTGGIKVNSS